ncbi:MAG: 6-bladed beta-propeller, partial [Candidatus Hodarchaeota archaeon]
MIAGKHYIDFLSINLLNITLLIFSIFFVDCSSENIKQIYKFSKVKEIKLNFLDGEIIGKIFDLLEHDNKFYLVDNQSHKIWVTDQKGQLLRTIGRKGQGPGDLNGPVSIALKGDTLLVLEKENSRISLFNNSG